MRRLEELGDSVQEVSDRLANLEALGVRLVTIEQSASSSNRPIETDSDLRADLLNLLQEMQMSQRSRRIRQGHARNRVKAMPPPGKAPYGYRRSKIAMWSIGQPRRSSKNSSSNFCSTDRCGVRCVI